MISRVLLAALLIWLPIASVQAVDASRLHLDAPLIQGALVRGKIKPGERLFLDGKSIQTDAKGNFVVGFAREHAGTATFRLVSPDGDANYEMPVAARTYQTEVVDGLPQRTVTPPKAVLERLRRERGRVGVARSFKTNDLDWQGDFVRPAEGRYSGFFGSYRILNGKPGRPHYGLDIAAPKGTPVLAPLGGTVRLADADYYYEGGIVIIDHGFGVSSTLFHMQSLSVEEGERIETGDEIGKMGAAGRATGSHVDWRINWGNVRLDPALVLPNTDRPSADINPIKE